MARTLMKIVGTVDVKIHDCPYCREIPVVTVTLNKNKADDCNDSIKQTIVTCTKCGATAPIDVWDAICCNMAGDEQLGMDDD